MKTLCWRTEPTWYTEASTVREIGAEGTRYTNLGTWSRADLASGKDCSMAESTTVVFRSATIIIIIIIIIMIILIIILIITIMIIIR